MIYSFEPHRSFLSVMKSEIIFRDFPYIWLRFLPLSVYSRCPAARERIEFKRSILLNLVSIKFVPLRSQSNHITASHQTLAKLLRSQSNPRSLQVIKPLQNRSAIRTTSIFAYDARISHKSLNSYNDVRLWITESIRRTTNNNHKQKERRSEERISHAKDNNLKKT
jgi:hypothetical protein